MKLEFNKSFKLVFLLDFFLKIAFDSILVAEL